MYKVKQIIFKNVNLPDCILYYISSFLTKYDVIIENKKVNFDFLKLKLRQRHRKKFYIS